MYNNNEMDWMDYIHGLNNANDTKPLEICAFIHGRFVTVNGSDIEYET